MNSKNILKACAKKKMRPLCDHPTLASDGKCILAPLNGYISLPSDTEKSGLPMDVIGGVYSYGACANKGYAYLDAGTSHKLANDGDRNYDTLCTNHTIKGIDSTGETRMKFTYNNWEFNQVTIHGGDAGLDPVSHHWSCIAQRHRIPYRILYLTCLS